MKDDDLKEFANQFIQSWQDNFAKLGEDNQLMELFTANMHNMQQFYDKSTAATFSNPFKPGADELKWRDLERRVSEVERKLETAGKAKAGNKQNGTK